MDTSGAADEYMESRSAPPRMMPPAQAPKSDLVFAGGCIVGRVEGQGLDKVPMSDGQNLIDEAFQMFSLITCDSRWHETAACLGPTTPGASVEYGFVFSRCSVEEGMSVDQSPSEILLETGQDAFSATALEPMLRRTRCME